MEDLNTALGIGGMFILRLGIPLLITLTVACWLRRLDARWQAEAEQVTEQPVLETEPETEAAAVALRPVEQPCWLINNCPQTVYTRCPAFQQADSPCWKACSQAEGQMRDQCYQCIFFHMRRPIHEPVN